MDFNGIPILSPSGVSGIPLISYTMDTWGYPTGTFRRGDPPLAPEMSCRGHRMDAVAGAWAVEKTRSSLGEAGKRPGNDGFHGKIMGKSAINGRFIDGKSIERLLIFHGSTEGETEGFFDEHDPIEMVIWRVYPTFRHISYIILG